MVVVRTVVTALPQTSSTEKTYRIDPAPSEPTARPTTTHGAAMVSVNLAQLLADLEAESRRVIGPSTPPPRS
jgi:hypothetical protein